MSLSHGFHMTAQNVLLSIINVLTCSEWYTHRPNFKQPFLVISVENIHTLAHEQCIEIIIIIDICNSTDYFLWTTPSKRMFLCCCTFVSCFRFSESFKVFSLFGCNRAFSRRNRNRSLFDSTKKKSPRSENVEYSGCDRKTKRDFNFFSHHEEK